MSPPRLNTVNFPPSLHSTDTAPSAQLQPEEAVEPIPASPTSGGLFPGLPRRRRPGDVANAWAERRLAAEQANHASQPAADVTPSQQSMAMPYSLSDLAPWRQPLLDAPEGSLSRQFGERLSALQKAVAFGQIDQDTFTASAQEIVEDLSEAENNMAYWDHHLANADIGLQYKKFVDAHIENAPSEPSSSAGNASERAATHHMEFAVMEIEQALNVGLTVAQAVEQARFAVQINMRYSILHSSDVAHLRDVAALMTLNIRHRRL